jgi:hypothetical protein
MFQAAVMTFIENCRHNILQLVKKLHLYMKEVCMTCIGRSRSNYMKC